MSKYRQRVVYVGLILFGPILRSHKDRSGAVQTARQVHGDQISYFLFILARHNYCYGTLFQLDSWRRCLCGSATRILDLHRNGDYCLDVRVVVWRQQL
jgi:hypothetical protein